MNRILPPYSCKQRVKGIGISSALYLQHVPERLEFLDAFTSAYPDFRVEIDSHLQTNHVNALLRAELDVAILIGCPVARRGGGGPWDRGELLFPSELPRLVLRRRPLVLIASANSPLAGFGEIPAAALAGQSVLILGPGHGRELVEPAMRFLEGAGAEVVVPAESTELSLARYVRQSGKPAISTGWFPAPGEHRGELVRRPIRGLALQTELAVVFRKGDRARPVRALHAFARSYVSHLTKQA